MYDRRTCQQLSPCLADAFLAGSWELRSLTARAEQVLDPRPAWIEALARRVMGAYLWPPADRPRELASYIAIQLGQMRGPAAAEPPRIRRWLMAQTAMGRRPWPVPEIATTAALAGRLGVSDGDLAWLADPRGLERTVADERLRNYRYSWRPRRESLPRVIERPKARLKGLQRRVLHELLDWIPAHDATHGFTRGRSALSNARAHTGRAVVMRFDLEDFFASVWARRVYGIFRTAGYPEPVAHTLTGLCTNVVPAGEWASVPHPQAPALIQARHRLGRRLATPHLPQGAPTSPALANLAAFRLDRRLTGLASAFDATYTRYADDLTLSGSEALLQRQGRVRQAIATIAREEGFTLNAPKTRVFTRAARQRVCGVVVNERPNVARRDYDRLKATVHNAVLRGPGAQNRSGVPDFRAHLLGRIAWVESLHPARGAKLRAEFARIDWGSG